MEVLESGNILSYRGRLAPTPSGYLHMGHARTFWWAQERALKCGGRLILRVEDLDGTRSKSEFLDAIMEDLWWFGFRWQEGPDIGGCRGPYRQSARFDRYREALERLIDRDLVYRCYCSRKDIQAAPQAPHAGDEGPLYPGTCRGNTGYETKGGQRPPSWRFRVPDGLRMSFDDRNLGSVSYVSGVDFGDFIVWRQDDMPAYQLAVTVDDHAMEITEVVRGEDLLLSTCRQLLLYRAFKWTVPGFFHCPLMTDNDGEKLSKRNRSVALRSFREQGIEPEQLRVRFGFDGVRF
ncbi:MAG: Glutamate--tRNA ligase [Verrucomicrobia subdivision 3 bacterium]|nr:Glutamate--tRNA ligase [Limisphaerales bacterium]MCS1416137.1 Glutamate--tRNA ligase [Limisphaerales bacterium]